MRFWQRIVLHRQKISKLIYNKQNILKFLWLKLHLLQANYSLCHRVILECHLDQVLALPPDYTF